MEEDEMIVPEIPADEVQTDSAAMVTVSATEWEELQRSAKEYKEKYLHALAEGENSRKRLQKERQELLQHSLQKTIVEFLNPIDQLENALKYADQASPDIKNWAIGFQMILNQFKDVLSDQGVASFVSEGQPFDPHYHEAVDTVVSEEHPPGIVLKEHIRGYTMGGKRVIRPARVHVTKAPSSEAPQSQTQVSEEEQANNNVQGGS